MSEILPIDVNTLRFTCSGRQFQLMGESPNRGLECYLTEAFIMLRPHKDAFIKMILDSAERICAEAQWLDSTMAWGWEKACSLPGVTFPLDWDDTSKAVDVLKCMQKLFPKTASLLALDALPSEQFWDHYLNKSLFQSTSLADASDYAKLPATALSVFFGPDTDGLRREDPMVTVALLRSTCLWYPRVKALRVRPLYNALQRTVFILNLCLRKPLLFCHISRYYFSLGHYAFRIIELIKIWGISVEEAGICTDLLHERVSRRSRTRNHPCFRMEDNWWFLTERLVGNVDNMRAQLLPPASVDSVDVVYRHKRLGHYYGARCWHWRLQCLIDKRLTDHIK